MYLRNMSRIMHQQAYTTHTEPCMCVQPHAPTQGEAQRDREQQEAGHGQGNKGGTDRHQRSTLTKDTEDRTGGSDRARAWTDRQGDMRQDRQPGLRCSEDRGHLGWGRVTAGPYPPPKPGGASPGAASGTWGHCSAPSSFHLLTAQPVPSRRFHPCLRPAAEVLSDCPWPSKLGQPFPKEVAWGVSCDGHKGQCVGRSCGKQEEVCTAGGSGGRHTEPGIWGK